jgi:hypothetical protein
MNNAHRVSLITFVSELCRHYGTAIPPPDIIIQTLNNIVEKYFNTPEGAFWIFYNSDVVATQEIDGSQYMFTPTGEHLDDAVLTTFCKDSFANWNQRIHSPSFTEEETQFLLSRLSEPPNIVWPALMWCGSPAATDWRVTNNPIYAKTIYAGVVLEYQGRIIDSDDVQLIGTIGGDCHICQETLPCVVMDNAEEIICEHCRVTNDQQPCPHSHTCIMYSCTHNAEKSWPIAAAGRRFHEGNSNRTYV